MAKHKIYIGNYGIGKMRLGDSRSTDYSYDSNSGLLQIYWRGEEVARCENVRAGDAFIVTCEGGEPQLSEMHLPRHPNDFLMYILGFGPGLRCHRWDYYDRALKEQRAAKLIDGRIEREFSGAHYTLNVCEDSDGKPYHLAGMMVGDLSTDEYLEILLNWPYKVRYPHEFLRAAFQRYFRFGEKDIEQVFKAWD